MLIALNDPFPFSLHIATNKEIEFINTFLFFVWAR